LEPLSSLDFLRDFLLIRRLAQSLQQVSPALLHCFLEMVEACTSSGKGFTVD
jgi:hypothetical protein